MPVHETTISCVFEVADKPVISSGATKRGRWPGQAWDNMRREIVPEIL